MRSGDLRQVGTAALCKQPCPRSAVGVQKVAFCLDERHNLRLGKWLLGKVTNRVNISCITQRKKALPLLTEISCRDDRVMVYFVRAVPSTTMKKLSRLRNRVNSLTTT